MPTLVAPATRRLLFSWSTHSTRSRPAQGLSTGYKLLWTWISGATRSSLCPAPERPKPHQQPHTWIGLDGHSIKDDYSWMETDAAGLRAHLTAESAYSDAVLAARGTTALADKLCARVLSQRAADERTALRQAPPGEVLGPWMYNSCLARGQLLVRSHLPAGSPTLVVLDDARLHSAVKDAAASSGLTLVPAVMELKLSKDHKLLAVTVPLVRPGWTSDAGAALLLDCHSGRLIEGGVLPGVGSVEWLPSGAALLATHLDHTGKAEHVCLHQLPRPGHHPATVHTLFTARSGSSSGHGPAHQRSPVHLSVGRTKNWQYMMISAHTKTSSEVHLFDGDWCGGAPPVLTCVKPREPGVEYMVECDAHGNLILLTNKASHQPSADRGGGKCEPSTQPAQAAPHHSLSTSSPHLEQPAAVDLDHQHNYTLAVAPGWGGSRVCGSTNASTEWQPLEGLMLSLSYAATGSERASSRASPSKGEPWFEEGISISDMDVFDGWCAVYGSAYGKPAVWVVHLSSNTPARRLPRQEGGCCYAVSSSRIALPAWATSITPGLNADYSAHTLRLVCSSPVHPPHTFDFNVIDQTLQLLHVEHVVGQFQGSQAWLLGPTSPPPHMPPHPSSVAADAHLHDPNEYAVQQVWVDTVSSTCLLKPAFKTEPTSQGLVPVTLAYHRSLALDGIACGLSEDQPARPAVLFGYGAYGQALDAGWNPLHLLLLQQGVVLAFAHVRGGGERGRAWHAAGRGLNKPASVSDFKQVAQALVAAGITAPGLLAVHAYSAGALLAGGLLADPCTRALISSAVLKLGFLDLVSVMHQPSLPLSLEEQEEWGQPDELRHAAVMRQVCPYTQLQTVMEELAVGTAAGMQGPLPPLLATAATHDARVPAWVPAKWIARARRLQECLGGDGGSPLLRVLWDRGHHADPQEAVQDWSVEVAFMMHAWQDRWQRMLQKQRLQ